MLQTTLSPNDSDIGAKLSKKRELNLSSKQSYLGRDDVSPKGQAAFQADDNSESVSITNDAERLMKRFRRYNAIVCGDLDVSLASDTKGRADLVRIAKIIFSTIAIGSLFLNASLLYRDAYTFSGTVFSFFVSGLHVVALGSMFFLLCTKYSAQREQFRASCRRLKDLSSQFLDLLKVRQQWDLKLRTVQFEFARKCDEVAQIAARITKESEKLRLAEETRLVCETQLESMNLAYNETAIKLESLNADVEEKLSSKSNFEKVLAGFEQENESLVKDQKSLNAELERTKLLIEESTQNLLRIDALVEAAHIDLAVTESLIAHRKTDSESLGDVNEQLRFENELARIALNEAEQKLAVHSTAVLDKQFEFSELKSQATDAQNLHEDLLSRTVVLETTVTQQQNAISEGEEQLAALCGQTLEVRNQLKVLLEEQAQVEQESSVILSRLGELERLSFTKLAIEAESERVQIQIECQQALLTELKSEESQVRDRVDLLNATATSTLAENENLTLQLELLAYRIANSTSVFTQRESQVLASEVRQHDLQLSIAECVRRIDEESARLVEAALLVEQSKQAADEAEKATADAERRTKMLSEKADALTERVEEKASQLFALKQEFIKVRSDLRDLELAKQEYAELERKLTEINASLMAKNLEEESLSRQLSISDSLLSLKTGSITSLDLEIEAIELRILAKQKLLYTEEHERSLLQLSREELEAEIESLSRSVDEYRSDMDKHQSVLQNLEAAITEVQLELEELETTKENQNKEIETMSEVANSLRNQTQTMELELAELEVLRASRVEMELQIENATIRLEELRHDEQSVQLLVDAKMRDADKAQSQLLELQRTIETLEKESNDSSLKLSLLSEDVIDAEKVSRQWSEYLASLSSEIAKQEGVKENLKLTIDRLVEQEQKHSRAADESEDRLQVVENKLQALGKESEAATVLLQGIQRESEESMARWTELRVHEQEANEKLQSLAQQIKDSESEIRELHAQIDVSLDRCCKQAQEVLTWDERIESLSVEVSLRERELDSLKLRCEELAIQSTCDEDAAKARRLEIMELEKSVATLESLKSTCDEQRLSLEELLLESNLIAAHIEDLKQATLPLELKREELVRLCTETEAQRLQLDSLHAKADDQNRQIAEVEASIAEKLAEQAAIQTRIAEGKLKLIELGDAQSAAMQQLQEQARQKDLAQMELIEKQEQNESVKVQLQQSHSQLAEIEQSFAEVQIQLREALSEKQALAGDNEQLLLVLDRLQNEQKDVEKRSVELDGEIQRKAAEVNSLQGDISLAIAKVAQFTELSLTLAEATSVSSSKLTEIENECSENSADLFRLQNNREQLASKCDEMRNEVAILEDRVATLRGEIAEMSQTKESVQQTLDSLTQTQLLAEPVQVSNEEQEAQGESTELEIWKTVLDLAEIGKSSLSEIVGEPEVDGVISETIQNQSVTNPQLDPWDSVFSIN